MQELSEVIKILKGLCSLIKEESDALIINQKIYEKLDFMFAKGMYGKEIKGQVPILKEGKSFICFNGARHPLLDKNKVVSNNISLGIDKDIIIVSGPNAGGKTVYLKTIGLLSLIDTSKNGTSSFILIIFLSNIKTYGFKIVFLIMPKFGKILTTLPTICSRLTGSSFVLLASPLVI